MTVSVEVTVAPPDLAAAAALFGAVVAIDLAALRWQRATISRWVRHQVRSRPGVALTAATALALHLVLDVTWDPAGWLARRFDRRHR